MIRVWTPPEPWALRRQRVRKLANMVGDGTGHSDGFFVGHDVFRDRLVRAQHFKCCWCDQRPTRRATVEHFRPKKEAIGHGQPASKAGYTWLAWTPENLLYACGECNRRKGTHFPLRPGSARLGFGERPPGQEHPLFVDPRHDDPADHICFFPDGAGKWRPTPRHGDERGQETLSKLGLDDDIGFFSNIDQHVDEVVMPVVGKLQGAAAADLPRLWDEEVGALLAPERELALLSHDVLAYHFEAAIEAGDVVLPRPWNAAPAAFDLSDEDHALRSLLERLGELPDDVVDAMATCHEKSSADDKQALLARLAPHITLTGAELALLLGGSATNWEKHLAAAGRATT